MDDASQSAQSDRVECAAAKDPAVRLFILAGMLILFGAWCFVDAFLRGKYPYPADGNLNHVISFYFNHVGGIALPLVGLVPLAWGIVLLRRKLVATAEGIGYDGKPPIAWADVTRLDATRLQEKGILRLEAGRGMLTLDSWKLQNFKALVAFVEEHVPGSAIETAAEGAAAEDGREP